MINVYTNEMQKIAMNYLWCINIFTWLNVTPVIVATIEQWPYLLAIPSLVSNNHHIFN